MAYNLKLGPDNDLIVGRGMERVEGLSYTTQLVKCRLLTVLGEWYADNTIGLPWFSDVMIKAPDLGMIEGLISTNIRECPHVISVTSIKPSLDKSSRILNVSFEALSDWGVINSTVTLGGN